MFFVFYSWFLYFENNNFMSKQKNHESISIVIDVQKKLYDIENILNSKIDKKMNNSNTKKKIVSVTKSNEWIEKKNQKFE